MHDPLARSQTTFCAGRGYLGGVAERQRWHSCRLPVEPDLGTEPIVSETPVYRSSPSLTGMKLCSNATQHHRASQTSKDHRQTSAGLLIRARGDPTRTQVPIRRIA